MNENKKIKLIRKRNSDLKKQLDNIKFEVEFHKKENSKGYQKAKDLISELENIKSEWLQAIKDLRDTQKEYQNLIDDLKILKSTMNKLNIKIPWYTKLLRFIHRN